MYYKYLKFYFSLRILTRNVKHFERIEGMLRNLFISEVDNLNMSKTLDRLYNEGVRIALPPRFTISADTGFIDKALRGLERCNKALDGEESLIVYNILSGFGGVEKFHTIYAASRAKEVAAKYRDRYGTITHGWLEKRKAGLVKGIYDVRGGIVWGYV